MSTCCALRNADAALQIAELRGRRDIDLFSNVLEHVQACKSTRDVHLRGRDVDLFSNIVEHVHASESTRDVSALGLFRLDASS